MCKWTALMEVGWNIRVAAEHAVLRLIQISPFWWRLHLHSIITSCTPKLVSVSTLLNCIVHALPQLPIPDHHSPGKHARNLLLTT